MFLRILLSFCALLLLVAVATGLLLLSARHALLVGVADLRLAQDRIQLVAQHVSLRRALRPIRSEVVQAQRNFGTADDRLGIIAPLIEHVGWVPWVGPEIAAAPHIAHAARRTTDGTLSLLAGLGPLASRWEGSTGKGRVPVLLAGLRLGRQDFNRACAQFDQAAASRRALPPGTYPVAVKSALQTLDDRLPRLQVFCRLLELAPALLGADRPTAYLVVYQNSAELRATGGFIGSASLVTVRRGLASQLFDGSGVVDNLSVPPPEPVQFYNHEPGWLFRDSNWSPDFPTSAALERFFYKLDFHRDVPNIVDLTPQATADLITATGPIYVPAYRQTVTGANVRQLADYYAHWAAKPGTSTSGGLDTRRKQFIGVVARQVLRHVATLSVKTLIALGEAVGTSLSHGDMLLNFRNASMQSLIRRAGAAHAVTPRRGDYLYVVNTNLSYNKINPFVHLDSVYDVRVRADRWLDARLTVRLRNVPAPPALKKVSIGPQAGGYGNWDDYATFLRIYSPPGAQLIDQRGWTQPWSQGPAYGGTMFSGYLIVPAGTSRVIQLHYIVPPNVFRSSGGTRYALLAPHQPGSVVDVLQVTLHHDGVHKTWRVAHPQVDWRLSSPIEPRPYHPLPLPTLPPPATAPEGWIEPHAFLAFPSSR